ncbi:hypothetical protein K1719_023184 [Acacia pycnantha]|nr:hypothetical protein K1719_023184 [Acacia pycnantha]
MAGLVLNSVNIHLNKSTIAFLLSISSSLAIMVDQEFFHLSEEALRYGSLMRMERGVIECERFLESGDSEFSWKGFDCLGKEAQGLMEGLPPFSAAPSFLTDFMIT